MNAWYDSAGLIEPRPASYMRWNSGSSAPRERPSISYRGGRRPSAAAHLRLGATGSTEVSLIMGS